MHKTPYFCLSFIERKLISMIFLRELNYGGGGAEYKTNTHKKIWSTQA